MHTKKKWTTFSASTGKIVSFLNLQTLSQSSLFVNPKEIYIPDLIGQVNSYLLEGSFGQFPIRTQPVYIPIS